MSFLRSAAADAVFQYNSSGVNEYSTFYKLFITKFQKIASMLRICNFKSFKKEPLIIQKQEEIAEEDLKFITEEITVINKTHGKCQREMATMT